MSEPQGTDYLLLVSRALRFASEHPYAATGIFGAAVGSFATYKVMTTNLVKEQASNVFTPKVYELAVPHADLRNMLVNPDAELRWELPEMSVIITAEKREQPKQLPVVDA